LVAEVWIKFEFRLCVLCAPEKQCQEAMQHHRYILHSPPYSSHASVFVKECNFMTWCSAFAGPVKSSKNSQKWIRVTQHNLE